MDKNDLINIEHDALNTAYNLVNAYNEITIAKALAKAILVGWEMGESGTSKAVAEAKADEMVRVMFDEYD